MSDELLTAEQAGRLLHLHVKRVQGLARTGRLPGSRIGRKWLFRRSDLERMLGRAAEPARAAVPAGLESLSARNHLQGRITAITVEGLMAEVRMEIGGQELTAIITRGSVERLGLRAGDQAFAVIKATEVMVARAGEGS
jgi:molybdopterin-binding protein